MGVVTWHFMQIKHVNIVWWQGYLSCISDIPRSAKKEKYAAPWQYSRKLITGERIVKDCIGCSSHAFAEVRLLLAHFI